MKLTSFMATVAVFCGISFFAVSKAEARVCVGINIGGPAYVQERVYVPYERVYVPSYPCCAPVYVAPPAYGEVYVVPGYREYRAYPSSGFSFGYWR